MNLHIVEQGQLVKYDRIGECTRCGVCCCTREIKHQTQVASDFEEDSSTAESTDYSSHEGFSVFWSQGLWWWIKPEILTTEREKPCSAFANGLCTIRQTDEWPAICRYWPVHPNDLVAFPNCGFRFERREVKEK